MTTSSTPDPACDRTTLALPWLLNGSLPAAERREVREHLIHCPQCRVELLRTREALATFQTLRAAAATEPEPAVAAAAGQGRFASRGRVLRPLSWAATIAALLTAAVGTWLVGTRSADTPATPTARRERPAPVRAADASTPAPTTSAAPTTTIADAAAPARQPAVSTPAGVTNPVTERAPAPAPTRATRQATKPGKTPAQPAAIFMTSFETGSLAPLANGAVEIASGGSPRISAADFESGELTWQ